ncbi:MAG: hypothetical protein ONA90_05475, partial [candidate division KSB1 bacterium]|nr:hypothetical protein [candidate division KSB1 bacterium]
MIIKEPNNQTAIWTSNPVLHFVRRQWKVKIIVAFIFVVSLVATSLASIYYGMHLYKIKAAAS